VLLDHLSWEQLQGWLAWLHVQPRGEKRDDIREGLSVAFLRQVSGFVEEKEDPYDFVLRFDEAVHLEPEVTQAIDELFAAPSAFLSFFDVT